MLDLENKLKTYTNKCITDCPFVFIIRPTDPGNGSLRVVMMEITEEQEKQLDAGKSLSLNRGGLSFNINPDFCLAYGDFDLSPNSKDLDTFYNADWFSRYNCKHYVPSNYNYETHTVTSDSRLGKWYDTTNIKVYLPYLYACINKPKRIVIFKEFMDIIALRKAEQKRKKQYEWNNKNKELIKNSILKRRANKRSAKLSKLIFNT